MHATIEPLVPLSGEMWHCMNLAATTHVADYYNDTIISFDLGFNCNKSLTHPP